MIKAFNDEGLLSPQLKKTVRDRVSSFIIYHPPIECYGLGIWVMEVSYGFIDSNDPGNSENLSKAQKAVISYITGWFKHDFTPGQTEEPFQVAGIWETPH